MAQKLGKRRHRKKAYIFALSAYGYMYLREYDRALEDVNIALNLRKDMSLAYFVRGKILHERKLYDEAMQALDQVLKARPLLFARLGTYLLKANIYAEKGRYEDATGKQQEPFTYGSLPGEKLYFKY